MLSVIASGGLPGYLFPTRAVGVPTARKLAFDAAWARVSRRYNATVDGVFDPSTGLPFFGSSAYTPTVWDTNSADVGDGVPDSWGQLVYDAVWLYAEAIANLTARGLNATNGGALRQQLDHGGH